MPFRHQAAEGSGPGADLSREWSLTGVPVDVLELQVGDLPRTKAEPGQQQQDGVVAAATVCATVTAPDEPEHFVRRNEARESGQSPVRNGGYRGPEVHLGRSLQIREAQEGPNR